MHVERYADLADEVLASSPRLGEIRLVAVDGPGGAGKSTFARRLAATIGGTPVVHTDDFASWENPLGWWDLLEGLCLSPLAQGRMARFRRYDWAMRMRDGSVWVPPAPVVILEGVSASRLAIVDRLSLAVFVDAPRDVRLGRGTDRDGPSMRSQWADWMTEEEAFFAADGTQARADLVVDGDPTAPVDPATEFVVSERRRG
jgi:uridine kinase